jgi:sugar lactone lactonase YvrE
MRYKAITFLFLLLVSNKVFSSPFDNLLPVRIISGLQFSEGPSWHPNGYLLLCDVDGNTVYKWDEASGLTPFISPSGKAIGTDVSRRNEFYACRQGARDIVKMDTTGKMTTLATQWNGKKFNGPNDVAVSYLGSIYFTDPDFNATDREMSFQGLFCIPYNDNSKVVLLDSTLVKPNGLTFVQDWKTLYVCESSTNTIYAYSLQKEDYVNSKKVFLKVDGNGEIDGITSDVYGYIYVAFGDGGIKIYDGNANLVNTIPPPNGEKVRNICFGGKHYNKLFVTAGTSVYEIEIRHNGDFINTGLLGAPTDTSIVFNALSDKMMEAYIAYGNDSTNLVMKTTAKSFAADIPMEINISGLTCDTRYYYKLYYRVDGTGTFQNGISGTFITQRAKSENFNFAVEADPHLDENSNYQTFRNTLLNIQKLKPDFLIDLGDNFMTEKFPVVNSYYIEQRNLLYRNFWDKICSSIPLYIVIGNHEGELGWLNKQSADDVFNLTNAIRKKYYPNPQPNGFYSGNDLSDVFLGHRENYYSWTWGDALFVVIDPYEFTSPKPTDSWGFTLGKEQYGWLKSTLEGSSAKYKFVFAHQIVGGDKEGRGGVEMVNYGEMGGLNSDGSYGFDTHREGWGKPIHQLLVDNGVQIYFHGHDHIYAQQEKDGVVYLEVPQPSLPQYTSTNGAEAYGYTSGTILPCSGHINVSVTSDSAVVDYISGYHVDNPQLNQINGTIRHRFTVKPKSISSFINTPSNSINPYCYLSGKNIIINQQEKQNISIKIFDINGQLVNKLYDGEMQVGKQCLALPDVIIKGVYIINIASKHSMSNIKVVL